ncbi:MAG TPA: hypothetical protein DCZ03_10795 [Gammaproteobacteria bacterium]|nr:hypothetical protein [Gammaproteobacteria bacterium]
MFQRIANEIWVCRRPFKTLGVDISGQMTIVRLKDGRLWLHSPVELDDEICAELDLLGPVAYAIAPNSFHHLFLGTVFERYPKAVLYGTRNLFEKRRDLPSLQFLDDLGPFPWGEDIRQVRMRGNSIMDEVVFYHKLSRTLILTDLFFNIHHHDHWPLKLFGKLMGSSGQLSSSRLFRLMIRDKKKFQQSVTTVLRWEIDQILVTHNENLLEGDVKGQLIEAFNSIGFARHRRGG